MKRLIGVFSLLLLPLAGLQGCQGTPEAGLTTVQVVTMVITGTPGPTQTPLVITEIETVVITATPAPSSTAPATPAAMEEPTAIATGTPGVAVLPIGTPSQLRSYRYEAPRLLSPATGVSFSDNPPTLEWEWVGLGEDEYYEVMIERLWQEQPYYSGSSWVKEPHLEVPAWVAGTSDTGQYTWWVTIKQQTGESSTGGKVGEAVSPPSEQRTFTWSQQ